MTSVESLTIPVRADVTVYRKTGVHRSFNAPSQSNTDRGDALLAGLGFAQDGSTIVVAPGTFDIGTSTFDLSLGGQGAVNLIGSGMYTSIISSAATYGGSVVGAAILHPGSNSVVQNIGVLANLTTGDYQGTVGANNNSASQSAFTDAVFRSCRFVGQSDSFYINHTTACSAKFYDCEFVASFDTILLSSATDHLFQFWNCYWNATGPNISASQPGRCRAIRVQQGTVQVFGGEIVCVNGGDNDNKAVTTVGSNATVELYGGVKITSTNTGLATAYDLYNQSGTIKVSAGVVYDDAKISGTITFLNVYGVTPTAAGLNTLST